MTGEPMSLIQRIDALLPQTQCGKCGHPGCKPYAQGIAQGEAINKCPPGGDETIAALAELLRVPLLSLDSERGSAPAQVAFIREAECIGCTKCIQACPVDAIVGAAKLMHTVISDECTGCDLCVAPCPVDCIDMLPLVPNGITPIVGGLAFDSEQRQTRAVKRDRARKRFEFRNARLHREEQLRLAERKARTAQATMAIPSAAASGALPAAVQDEALKKARIAVAMSRAQLHKALKAFRHPPIAEQAVQLRTMGQAFEQAKQELERLLIQNSAVAIPTVTAPTVDDGNLKRAKIQLAMARAALNKARTNQAPQEQLQTLGAEVERAEQALQDAGQPPIKEMSSS
jgi:electron transport complex protein RnfB